MMGLPPPDVARVPWTVAYDQIKDLVAAKNDLAVEYELLAGCRQWAAASVTLPLVVHAPARRPRPLFGRGRFHRASPVGDGGILCRREIVVDTLLPLARPVPSPSPVPLRPHILIELRQALVPYQDYHLLLLTLAGRGGAGR